MTKQTLTQLEQHELFLTRHIGPNAEQQQEMLNFIGAESLEDLTAQTVPGKIRYHKSSQSVNHVAKPKVSLIFAT